MVKAGVKFRIRAQESEPDSGLEHCSDYYWTVRDVGVPDVKVFHRLVFNILADDFCFLLYFSLLILFLFHHLD